MYQSNNSYAFTQFYFDAVTNDLIIPTISTLVLTPLYLEVGFTGDCSFINKI